MLNSSYHYLMDSSQHLVTIIEQDAGVIMFSAKYNNEIVEGTSHYRVEEEILYLDKLHLEGSTPGKVGRKALWEMAKDLGRQHNAKEVVVQGGRRTTGKYQGQVPSLIRIKID